MNRQAHNQIRWKQRFENFEKAYKRLKEALVEVKKINK